MKFFHKTGICLFIILSSYRLTAQERGSRSDVFNSDPVLYNGRIYIFYPPAGTEGDQYLTGKQFSTGTLKVRGKTYADLILNYDIYNQQVVLRLTGEYGSVRQIIIPDLWLESFTLDRKIFEAIQATENNKIIYQVIGNGPFRILYYWQKKLGLNRFHGAVNRVFTKPLREMYLDHDGTLKKFRNNKSFSSLFLADRRELVRKFLHDKKINVKKADDQAVEKLILFCDSI